MERHFTLAAPPPEPSNAFNADDGNVIGVVYSIDALDDPGFVPMVGQALLPPGGQAMEPAASYHSGAGTSATGPRQALSVTEALRKLAQRWQETGDVSHGCSSQYQESAPDRTI